MGFKESLNVLKANVAKHSPTILTITAAIGVVGVAWSTHRAALKADEIITTELKKRQEDLNEAQRKLAKTGKGELIPNFTRKDIFLLTWKCYLAPAGIGVATIACIIGANRIHLRKYAALASAYGVTSETYRAYKAKVAETFGKNKELKVRDEIAGDKIKNNPPAEGEIIFTGKGEMLCYDSLSGRYFKSDIENIRRVINDKNHELNMGLGYMDLNDLYYDLGLPPIEFGKMVGWSLEDGIIDPNFSSRLTDKGEPCLVLSFEVNPKHL